MISNYSNSEISFLNNQEFILLKTSLLDRVNKQLSDFGKELHSEFRNTFNESLHPKVSKGENLKGLPYRLLDYPRLFSTNNIFAFRQLFWWGNYISSTLHIKGSYLKIHQSELKSIASISHSNLYYSNSGDEWNHDIYSEDYHAINSNSFDEIAEFQFLKICRTLPLDQLNNLDLFLKESKELLLNPFT